MSTTITSDDGHKIGTAVHEYLVRLLSDALAVTSRPVPLETPVGEFEIRFEVDDESGEIRAMLWPRHDDTAGSPIVTVHVVGIRTLRAVGIHTSAR